MAKEQRTAQRGEQRLTRHPRSENRFHIDPAMIPDGSSYEWKRLSVFDKEDRQHQVHLARNHWVPVPAGRHPELSGEAPDSKKSIVIDGLILMERPSYLTDEAHEEDQRNAFDQVGTQMQRLQQTEPGTFERDTPQVKRSVEPLVVPDDMQE
jgi:hypothetical protein